MEYGSKWFENAVEALAQLPGVGKKTALRFVLEMLRWPQERAKSIPEALTGLLENINYCNTCHNLSDQKICTICANPSRDESILCLVADIRDIMAIEATRQFKGKYHVLGGLISPMEGVGPKDLNIASLVERVEKGETKELLLALSGSMEGDTTNYYIYQKLANMDVQLSTLARGVAIGDELEYADEITLARSIQNRLPYESTLKKD